MKRKGIGRKEMEVEKCYANREIGVPHRKLNVEGWNVESNHPRGVSEVWQTQGLETGVFGSVAIARLTGEFSDLWQGKELEKRK